MRKRDFYEVTGNFASGILSPAGQDDVGSPSYRNGAALLENFDLLRDGGACTRAPLRRLADAMPKVGRNNTVPDWPGGGYRPNGGPTAETAGSTPGWTFSSATGASRRILLDGTPFFTFQLTGGPIRHLRFLGARLRRGPWRIGSGDDAELVFRLRVAQWNTTTDMLDDYYDVDLRAADKGDPFDRHAFAPGRVRRDLSVAIPRDNTNNRYRFITSAQLYVAISPSTDNGRELALPGNVLELEIEDVQALTEEPPFHPENTWEQLLKTRGATDDVARLDGLRIIPWTIHGLDLAVVLGVESQLVAGARKNMARWTPNVVIEKNNAWGFTARQLRELTWCVYGSHLLLFHEDFPRPLAVRVAGTGALSIDYLPMVNVPLLPGRLDPEARLDVTVADGGGIDLDQPQPPLGAALRAVVPRGLRAVQAVGSILVYWRSTSAHRYKVFYQPKSSYDAIAAGQNADKWRTTPQTAVKLLTTPNALPSQSITGLTGGTEYAISVASVVDASDTSIAGETSPNDAQTIFALALKAKLKTPLLRAVVSTTSDGDINLSWTNTDTNTQEYVIQYKRSGTVGFLQVETRPTVHTATTLRFGGFPGRDYDFRVMAKAEDAEDSDWSNVVTVRAVTRTPPGVQFQQALPSNYINGRVGIAWVPENPHNANLIQAFDLEIRRGSSYTDTANTTRLRLTNADARRYDYDGVLSGGAYQRAWARIRSRRVFQGVEAVSAWSNERTINPQFVNISNNPTEFALQPITQIGRDITFNWPTWQQTGIRIGNPAFQLQFAPYVPGQERIQDADWSAFGVHATLAPGSATRFVLGNTVTQSYWYRIRAYIPGSVPLEATGWGYGFPRRYNPDA